VSLEQLVDLRGALDSLVRADSFSLSDKESIVALERELARFEYVVAEAVAAFDAGGEWALDGAKTTAAWLMTRCHLPSSVAKAQLRRGKVLEKTPVSAQALSEGDIGVAQFDLLAKAAKGPGGVGAGAGAGWEGPDTEAAFCRDEALLVHHAKEMKFAPFAGVLAYWGQLADPDGAEASDMERIARRDVYLTKSISDMYLGKMNFDPISGAIVAAELARLEQALFEEDWKKAKDELGREPHLHELCRTPAQRRADAMVEMATRSASAPADGRRPEPLFTVLVGFETLHGRICELEGGGGILSPGTLLPWLDGATFERLVFGLDNRVECSVKSRLYTGATRRAIEVRDRVCTHEFCDEPVQNCQGDHIVLSSRGGETTQENGRLLCGFHNRLRNGREPPDG
jgi:hypothetical protein